MEPIMTELFEKEERALGDVGTVSSSSGCVSRRSIVVGTYRAEPDFNFDDSKTGYQGDNDDNDVNDSNDDDHGADYDGDNDGCDEEHEEGEEKTILLTESTHSLLFTEDICSLPFLFALLIVMMSYACLILALLNNTGDGPPGNRLNVPVGVSKAVRGAQYLANIIGLLMEEEIPQGLLLLRMISKQSLRTKLPQIKFWKFVASALIRLVMGYIFLLNMALVIIQASDVLEIFYDILALQFVQQIDDIAFRLAKMDVFGKRLRRATTTKYFYTPLDKVPFSQRRTMSAFLKTLYFLNLCALLGGLAIVASKQEMGDFHCSSVTVNFGDAVWEDAVVTTSTTFTTSSSSNSATNVPPSDGRVNMVLVYSYFNGVYKRNGTHDGRPVYTEQNKVDNTRYNTTIGAEIKYCAQEGSWVFTHENIRKSGTTDDSDCPWLLRSPDTLQFDLLEVSGDWSIWTGTINSGAQISVVCDECNEESDCNYHGACIDKECVCFVNDGYFGNRCEHREPCQIMKGQNANDTWAVLSDGNLNFRTYSRPVYQYQYGLEGIVGEEDALLLVYSGSRWFGMYFEGMRNASLLFWAGAAREFHAFWNEAYTARTVYVSDPTSETTPIGVDFYLIGERGKQYGPFGVLNPLQEPPGRGLYYCGDDKDQLVTKQRLLKNSWP